MRYASLYTRWHMIRDGEDSTLCSVYIGDMLYRDLVPVPEGKVCVTCVRVADKEKTDGKV